MGRAYGLYRASVPVHGCTLFYMLVSQIKLDLQSSASHVQNFDILTVREDICRSSKVIDLPVTGRVRRECEVMCGLEIIECGLTLKRIYFYVCHHVVVTSINSSAFCNGLKIVFCNTPPPPPPPKNFFILSF
jgi:hypothetical protein